MLAEAGIVMGAAAVAALGHGVQGRSSQLFGLSVWRGPRDRKQIALTFDDGPSDETPRLLDLLDTLYVRATFFQCGQNVKRLPAISRAISVGPQVDQGRQAAGSSGGPPSERDQRILKVFTWNVSPLSSPVIFTRMSSVFFEARTAFSAFWLPAASRAMSLLSAVTTP